MIFEGITRCPSCDVDLKQDLRNILRKADDIDVSSIECPHCENPIVVHCRIVHHVEIVKEYA